MTNNKIFSALREKPELMAALLAAKKAIPERGAAETEQDKFIRSLLGNAASKEEVSSAADDIDRNPVMQLFLQSDGLLDPKELMDYVGDFSGDKANPNQNAAVKALFDGKLSIKEILLLIALFKLFKGKTQQTTTQSSGNSLLNTLLGGGQTQTTSGNSLFGLAQPQQTQQSQQTQSLNNILNSDTDYFRQFTVRNWTASAADTAFLQPVRQSVLLRSWRTADTDHFLRQLTVRTGPAPAADTVTEYLFCSQLSAYRQHGKQFPGTADLLPAEQLFELCRQQQRYSQRKPAVQHRKSAPREIS